MNISIPLAAVAAFVIACSDGTLPPRAANDPSNPHGPEGTGAADDGKGGAAPSSEHEHHHHPLPAPTSMDGSP
jgi:hypothetical protein